MLYNQLDNNYKGEFTHKYITIILFMRKQILFIKR
mgnify:CR=1 FL=1